MNPLPNVDFLPPAGAHRVEKPCSKTATTSSDKKERVMALLAWEAATERLRESLKPSNGRPDPELSELADGFANLAARLDDLRCVFLSGGSVAPDEGSGN